MIATARPSAGSTSCSSGSRGRSSVPVEQGRICYSCRANRAGPLRHNSRALSRCIGLERTGRLHRCAAHDTHGTESDGTDVPGAPLPDPSGGSSDSASPPASNHAAASPAPEEPPAPTAAAATPSPPSSSRRIKIQALQASLLAALSSVDRGLAAKAQEAREVDALAAQLELLGGPVKLRRDAEAWPAADGAAGDADAAAGDRAVLSGMWRLVYTSGFNSGSLGGSRLGPPAALFPLTLGQVYQRIDARTAKLDNIVELLLGAGLPDLTAGLLGRPSAKQDSPAVRLTLRHDYEVQGSSTVQIVFQETSGELVGSSWFRDLPQLALPSLPEPLRPPRFLRSAKFEVSFLDGRMRVTRGDVGELRIYLRDDDDQSAAAQLEE